MNLVNKLVMGFALAALSSCGVTAQQTPDCGKSLQTLTVGSLIPFAPFESLENDEVVGFDASVACELRKRLGFNNVVFKNLTLAQLIPALQDGSITVIISAFPITAGALAQAGFVAYSNVAESLLFKGSVPAGFTGANALANLNTARSSVGVVAGSREATILTTTYPNINDVTFANIDLAVAALAAAGSTLNAVFSQTPAIDTAATASKGALVALDGVVVVPNPVYNATHLGIGVNSDCCQLYVNIRQAIADMVADNTLADLTKKFGTVPLTAPGTDLTPASCADFTPDLPERNAISEFIFDKYCACTTPVVTA